MSARRTIQILVLGFIVLLSAQGFGQQSPVPLPAGVRYVTSVEGIDEYGLENGLRVLLFPDATKSNITVNVTYMVGSRHENYGETGMAHLLEHLMFMGSKNHLNIKKELDDHGARPNGSTWLDRTNYFETFQATDENLNWALNLEADRMVNAFIAKKDLDSEMTVVRNEFERGENDPQGVLQERTMSTAYIWHNYGNSTIGARSDIEAVPIDRLQAFYRNFYQPDNALLVVTGKFDEAKTLALVKQYFAPIPKPERQLRKTYTVEPTQDGERLVTLRRVGDVQALCVMYHIPSGASQEFAAIDIASLIYANAPSGRLYKALVESGKAASIDAGTLQLMDPGLLMAMAEIRADKSLDDAQNAMLAAFDEIKSKPFTDEEMNRAKAQTLKGIELLLNNSERSALNLSEWQSMGDWRLLFLYRDTIKKITRDEVQRAAEKYFVPSNRTIGRFIPDKTPVRAEIPPTPDVAALVKDYKGTEQVAKGEEFDATPENIEKRVVRIDTKGGIKLSLLSKKSRGEQVNATIVMRFGDEQSLKGQLTAAAATAQMLMKGTARHTRQQIQDELDRLKARVNVGRGTDNVSVSIQTTRENLKPVLDLVAEFLKEPVFPESEYTQLKQMQLAMMESQKSEPTAMVQVAIQRYLSPFPKGDVRYVETIDETIEGIKTLELEQVKAFHKNFYGASDSLATFVGDFDPEAVQKQMEELFSNWKSPKKYTRIQTKFQKLAPKAETFMTPDKTNAMWVTGSAFQMNDTNPDYPAITLAGYIFGSSPMNSRLFARIRGKEGLSYGVGGQISISTEDDMSAFIAYAICAPQNGPKVETVFKEELNLALEKGFTSEEVEAAKKSWVQLQQVNRAQDGNLVMMLTAQRIWNRTMAFNSDLEKKIMSLTPAQLQEALRKYIDPSQLSYFRGGDFQKAGVTW